MEKTGSEGFLIFDVGEMQYALPIEYAAFIVMAKEKFPTCIPPKMPAYVKCVMQMEQGLVPIVDFAQFTASCDSNGDDRTYPLVLILNYQNSQVGLLTDHITMEEICLEAETQREVISHQLFIKLGEKKFILFDVPAFYERLKSGQT